MKPERIAENYDALAEAWREQHHASSYGIAQLDRAIAFVSAPGIALDVGCGSSNRFLNRMQRAGFDSEGLDISPEMIRIAREELPNTRFTVADVQDWNAPRSYNLISAWDSTFHLPFEAQEPTLKKLCAALAPNGVLLMTCGAPRGEIEGEFSGFKFGYSSLGVNAFLQIVIECSCDVLHVECDQHPLDHVVIIARRQA